MTTQADDGHWTAATSAAGSIGPAEIETTARATTALARIGYLEDHAEAAAEGAKWLASQQLSNGAWPGLSGSTAEGSARATALALEAVARSGLNNLESVAQSAVAWLEADQAVRPVERGARSLGRDVHDGTRARRA